MEEVKQVKEKKLIQNSRRSCPECHKTFHKNSLSRHMKTCNKVKPLFLCLRCGVKCSRRDTLKAHNKRGTCKPKPSTWDCYVCGRIYKAKKTLNRHLRTHHIEEDEIEYELKTRNNSHIGTGHVPVFTDSESEAESLPDSVGNEKEEVYFLGGNILPIL